MEKQEEINDTTERFSRYSGEKYPILHDIGIESHREFKTPWMKYIINIVIVYGGFALLYHLCKK